ncbi:MAG TPA: hypothetical protein VLS89_00955 [Candidatus Nanopelagicales bacterium]|nr:hypothetical protein [Candidatus Nanopelagicales bacterium]
MPALLRSGAAFALLGALAALVPACRAERGAPYRCTCPFVTDFDDDSRQDVEICAPDADRAPAVARGCAQSGAPGPVQSCACRPAGEPASCEVGACRLIGDQG